MPGVTRASGLAHYLAAAVLVRAADGGAAVALLLLALDPRLHLHGAAAVGGFLAAALSFPHLLGPWTAHRLDRSPDGRRMLATAYVVYAAALAGGALSLGHAPFAVTVMLIAIAGCCGPLLTGGLSSRLAGISGSGGRIQGWDAMTYGVGGTAGPAVVAAVAATTTPLTAVLCLSAAATTSAVLTATLPTDPPPAHPASHAGDGRATAPALSYAGREPARQPATATPADVAPAPTHNEPTSRPSPSSPSGDEPTPRTATPISTDITPAAPSPTDNEPATPTSARFPGRLCVRPRFGARTVPGMWAGVAMLVSSGPLRRVTTLTMMNAVALGALPVIAVTFGPRLTGAGGASAALTVAFGVGNLAGSSLVTIFPLRGEPDRLAIWFFGVLAVVTGATAFAHVYVAALVGFAVIGAANAVSFTSTLAARAAYAPAGARARVFVTSAGLKVALSSAGSAAAGGAAGLGGPVLLMVAAAVTGLAVVTAAVDRSFSRDVPAQNTLTP